MLGTMLGTWGIATNRTGPNLCPGRADSLMRIQKINPYTKSYRTERELGKGTVKKNNNRARGQRMVEVPLLQLGGQVRPL